MSAGAGRDIAASMASLLTAPPGDLSPVQAAQRIRAWHEAMRTLSAVAEAQVMEACWIIRSHHPEREAFGGFLAAQGTAAVLDADRAWLMAETWEAARRSHAVRSLASTHPLDAMEFVRDFVETGQAERLHTLDDEDREMIALLSSPPRTRRSKLRALLAAQQSEPDTESGETEPPPAPDAAAELVERIDDLQDCVRGLERLAGEIPALLLADRSDRARRERLPLITDQGMGALERIADGARAAEETLGR